MSFPDAMFDVVLSLLCLHNIDDARERADACREIARVLKPGGTVLLGDYVPTHDYAAALAAAGLTVRSSRPYFREAYGLTWIVEAVKPRS
jgi:arsenite methyltransferase